MPGTVKHYVDFSVNTSGDTGEANPASVKPILDGEKMDGVVLSRPAESVRQRTEALRDVLADTLYLRDADRGLLIAGPGRVSWPGSVTAGSAGIPTLSDVLWVVPMLSPGSAQTSPVPPVASAYGALHLRRASDSANAILVASRRRSHAGGDEINVTVSAGSSFSCTLRVEDGPRRSISVVATPSTTLSTVITALNGLTPPAPDATQLVQASLEGGALGTDLVLDVQARQYVEGNYDGEGHAITPANLAGFFSSNPGQALAEGDTLCVRYASVTNSYALGGRRQSLPEEGNTAIPAGSYFNSRLHPENLTNAIPLCKVVDGRLTFATGMSVAAGAVNAPITGTSLDTSIVRNGSFERATTNAVGRFQIADWENRDGGSAAQWRAGTTAPRTGVRCLELVKGITTASSTRVEQGQEINVSPGQSVRVVAWVRQLVAPTAGTCSIGLYWGDLDGGTVTSTLVGLQVLATTDASFRRVAATVTVPAGKRVLKKVTVETTGMTTGSTGVVFLVDDLVVLIERTAEDATSPSVDQHGQVLYAQGVRLNAPDASHGDPAAFLRYVATGDAVTANVSASDGGAVAFERVDTTYDASRLPSQWAVLGRLVAVGREVLASDATARLPRLETPFRAGAAPTLLLESRPATGSGPGLRVYRVMDGVDGLALVTNASFDGTSWVKDVTGSGAVMLQVRPDGVRQYARTADAPWASWTLVTETRGPTTTTTASPGHDPLSSFFDTAGNRRVARDHLGLARRQSELRVHQNWLSPMLATWTNAVVGTGTSTVVMEASSNKPGPWLRQSTPAASDVAVMHAAGNERVVRGPWNSSVLAVLEYDVDGTDLVGTPAITHHVGLVHDEAAVVSTEDCVKFYKSAASANWRLVTTASTTGNTTNVDTGVPPGATPQRMRIEVYGSGWPGGARALGYIDGVLVAESVTNLPDQQEMLVAVLTASTGATNRSVYISPVDLVVRRRVSDDAV